MIGLGPALAAWAALQMMILVLIAAAIGAGVVGLLWWVFG